MRQKAGLTHNMRSFDYVASAQTLLTPRTLNLLYAIEEGKGRHAMQKAMRPDKMNTLVEVARIQSTSASNRIEGIATSDKRLNALMLEKVAPHNRDEEEIAGYRDVLSTIHDSHEYIPLTPNVILQLHRDLFRHTPLAFGGRFKDGDNVIVERDSQGAGHVRFAPPSALMTPGLLEKACKAYNDAIRGNDVNPLLAAFMFVFDFTCIHPFNDGNGRMSRLLTLLLMYRGGYDIGKYISVEHLIERSKETYYESLAASTRGWENGSNDYGPFVNYMLGVVLAAYKECNERFEGLSGGSSARMTKDRRVADQLMRSLRPLSKADILAAVPDVSTSTVERALKRLLDGGKIEKIGAGRGTRYVWRR